MVLATNNTKDLLGALIGFWYIALVRRGHSP
jgi:hypothetical protein